MDIKKFIKERDSALLSMDKSIIEEFFKKYNPDLKIMDDENVFWLSVHKVITGATSIPRDKRLESAKWLLERGSTHFMDDITPDELSDMDIL